MHSCSLSQNWKIASSDEWMIQQRPLIASPSMFLGSNFFPSLSYEFFCGAKKRTKQTNWSFFLRCSKTKPHLHTHTIVSAFCIHSFNFKVKFLLLLLLLLYSFIEQPQARMHFFFVCWSINFLLFFWDIIDSEEIQQTTHLHPFKKQWIYTHQCLQVRAPTSSQHKFFVQSLIVVSVITVIPLIRQTKTSAHRRIFFSREDLSVDNTSPIDFFYFWQDNAGETSKTKTKQNTTVIEKQGIFSPSKNARCWHLKRDKNIFFKPHPPDIFEAEK